MLARGGTAIFTTSSPWQAVAPYLAEDPAALFAVNLESPFGDFPTAVDPLAADMNLCADPREVDVLIDGGIDLLTLTNNHSEDCVGTDPGNTARALEAAGIEGVAANEVVYVQAGRQTAAFLAINAYSGEEDLAALITGIKIARANSDLVVVSIHWGNEYQAGSTRQQEELAQTLVDAGVDLLWGHHPHVLQRMEWRESSVDGHHALVMYSLGNLLSDQWMLPDAMRTALVRIEFKRHEIKRIEVLPLRMDATAQVLQPALDNKNATLITDRLGLVEMERIGVRVEVWGTE